MELAQVHTEFDTLLAVLPNKLPVQVFTSEQTTSDLAAIPEQDLRNAVTALQGKLAHRLHKWEENKAFFYKLPPSIFSQNINKPVINYRQPQELDDRVQVTSLSEEQLSSIKKDGTFLVNSKYYSIPYKWRLTQWIYKGEIPRDNTLKKDVAKAYDQFYQIPLRVTSDQVSLKKGVRRLVKFVPNLLNLLIGLRKVHDEAPDYERFVEQERHMQIFEKLWPEMQKSLYNKMNIPILPNNLLGHAREEKLKLIQAQTNDINAFVVDLTKVDQDTENYWIENKNEIQEMLSQHSEGQILGLQLQEEKYRILSRFLGNKLKESPQLLAELEAFVRIIRCIVEAENQMNRRFKEENEKFEQALDAAHPIRRYSTKWRSLKTEAFRTAKAVELRQQMLQTLRNKLNIPIFNIYLQYLQTFDTKLQKYKQQMPVKHIPNRQFRCPYKLFPPYLVEEIRYPNGDLIYVLTKQKNKFVRTNFPAWKIVLNFVRWVTWTKNIIYWLFRGLWCGRLGLRVLIGCETFYPRYDVDPKTGALRRSREISWDPISVSVQQTCRQISYDRQQFQNAPDNGFFGKSCARVFNIIYNYVWRLFFVLIMYLLILKPLIIIFNVLILSLLATTAILWVPVIIIMYYVFNICIYNFDLDERHPRGRYSQRFFPIVNILIKFIYDFLYTIVALLGFVYHPLLAFLFAIFAATRYLLRNLYDGFMYCIIKCAGRSPVRDTSMAWRISGPGLSRQYFQNIPENDVYILVMSELEKLELANYEKNVIGTLRGLGTSQKQFMSVITKPMSMNFIKWQQIDASIQMNVDLVTRAVNVRRHRYPNYPGRNVRFSEKELEKYFTKSVQLVQNFVHKSKADYLFKDLAVKNSDTVDLTCKIWIRIFGTTDILEPFEELDQRFELVNEREDQDVEIVLKNIKIMDKIQDKNIGNQVYARLKKLRKAKDVSIVRLTDCIQPFRLNTQKDLPISKHQIQLSVVFNPNIQEILQEQNTVAKQRIEHHTDSEILVY